VDAADLRAAQAPLREQYKTDAASAATPVSGHGTFEAPGITCTVDTWAGKVRAGLHRATGGDGSDACSGDMLLEALAACAGVTLRSLATAMRLDIGEVRMHAEAIFDARGTLGVDRSVPVGIQGAVVTAEVRTDADDAALERLARSTERYCVVGQSLCETPRFVVHRLADEPPTQG
jgi:uncharacterized OsmC-like protein